MERNELLSLITSAIILLVVIFTFIFLLKVIFNQKIKMINGGLCDEELINEYKKENRKSYKVLNLFNAYFSAFLGVIFIGMFLISLYAQTTGNDFPISGIANARVVLSDSMSKKHETNTYLEENNLDNQFDKFDIILTYELPEEKDLKLYDVVVYEVNGTLVVHRIIGIEEPNKNHPEERYFLLKGDASEYKDRYPVKYEQMKAIYKGETIPYIGVFILFFQSTLGYIAMAIILGYCIIIPLAEKELDKIIINYLISNALIKVSNNTFDTNRIKRILIRRVSCENKR